MRKRLLLGLHQRYAAMIAGDESYRRDTIVAPKKMTLPTFDNEQDFREQWKAPFLSRMGFILPKNIHGRSEQGKDFFFAEHDRFGHLRLLAAQAKLGNICTGNDVHALWDQIQRSFDVTLKYHNGAHGQRISAVYVMTTGSISTEAQEQIWDQSRAKGYGENVYFLDGRTLANIGRQVLYASDSEKRKLVSAMRSEAVFNRRTLDHLQSLYRQGKRGPRGFVLIALQECLKTPGFFQETDALRHLLLLLTNISNRHQPILGMEMFEQEDFDSWERALAQADDLLRYVEEAANGEITQLDAKYSLTLEIVAR